MIRTERLILRDWREADVAPFAAMGRDPEVMAYLGPMLDTHEVRAAIERQRGYQATLGHCFWALERLEDGAFLGFCGLKPGAAGTPIEGEVEIGWRLARDAWGQGYAREAAAASLDWGWARGMPRITAITVPANVRSWGLMERLGMRRLPDQDFAHPALAPDDPLSRHIVYAIDRPA
ncbi:GNAT family N-acetyltransferase [Sphingomonas spermidinifaciens]|uniref:GNAT family N-acetyltransferase n=1 Tax=Sphingomonas spermidinifaciens TaxID=1141889 RepID=A0A2A4B689_9SPHN|nr:GNAT family N-acetyltransferase [Sphingomonas spermidinifaciens]PCD03455.1 GNAT family N-acetyltransferase [Sphingomonas spermidinifaciens]